MTKRNLLIFFLIAATCVIALLYIPKCQLYKEGITAPEGHIDLENRLRATLAQIFLGVFLLIGLYLLWRRVSITERSIEIALEGQITERLTRAIDQIGARDERGEKRLEIRLGGIFALERIARYSMKDHWQVMEILTAYVREHAGQKRTGAPEEEIPLPSADIQAILTVIGRRRHYDAEGPNQYIDLRKTDLRMANLEEAKLERANLEGTNLQKAKLSKATLKKANLGKADLKEANLEEVNLEEANLGEANLEEAYLSGVNLDKANLGEANLNKVYLWKASLKEANLAKAYFGEANLVKTNFGKANLQSAVLWEANLQEASLGEANLLMGNLKGASLAKAYLWKTNLQEAYLDDANLDEANLWEANLEKAHLSKANLERANLSKANLKMANLSEAMLRRARNLTIEQISLAKTLYKADLEPELMEQIRERHPYLLEKPAGSD